MSVNVPDPNVVYGRISQALVAIRDNLQTLVNENGYITSLGGSAALQAAPFNLTANDANALIATLGNHVTLNSIYQGTAAPGAFNYMANGQPFWNGQ